MESKLILDVTPEQIAIALTEDGRLVEFSKESREASFSVGNIYLAKVKKIMPGLNAAFVDVGYEKDAFLHYLDLGIQFNSSQQFVTNLRNNPKKAPNMNKVQPTEELPKDGQITDYLVGGKEVLVQVVKEPISTKGPRLTAEISLAGRGLVLLPFGQKVSISQKIQSNEERFRLKKIIQQVKPANYGVIVRTVAEGKSQEELVNELHVLIHRWEEALHALQRAKQVPSLVVEEIGRAEAILRDHFNPNYDQIVVNDKEVYEALKSYVSLIEPSRTSIVKYYDDELPIFDVYNLTKQIKSSFGRIVPFRKGAYLVIEHTEALHVIDVNSGTRNKSSNVQEENAFEVNMAAVDEIAHQLRLRDMGGIVIIDLIDMRTAEHKHQVYERMCDNMKSDSAKHQVLPLTKFGLMQITRQRVRPVTEVDTLETCPTCHGSGKIASSILFVDFLASRIEMVEKQLKTKRFVLYVHPFVYAFLRQGCFSILCRWRWKYGFRFKVLPNYDYSLLQYRFVDSDGNELDVQDNRKMV